MQVMLYGTPLKAWPRNEVKHLPVDSLPQMIELNTTDHLDQGMRNLEDLEINGNVEGIHEQHCHIDIELTHPGVKPTDKTTCSTR